MAAGAKGSDEIAAAIEVPVPNVKPESIVNGDVKDSDLVSNGKSECQMQDIVVHMLDNLKLNPMAKEFVPSSYNRDQMIFNNFVTADKTMGGDGFRNNRRRGNNFNQGKRRMHSRSFRAQREDSIRRTVYVSDLDINITEEQLAALFSAYGQFGTWWDLHDTWFLWRSIFALKVGSAVHVLSFLGVFKET